MKLVATFSIAAYDPKNQEWGVGVQSKFLAVGAVVPFARAGVGAIATQSYANYCYGQDGLALMEQGKSARETIELLTSQDSDQALRQVGAVDSQGTAYAFTGSACYDWAGHIVGDGFTCQGNILIPGTVEAMANAFRQLRKGEGELADWLLGSLLAGQKAGGDSRGRQSAAVLVVREGGGYGGNNDHYLDLRVDDHPTPLLELQRLLGMHHLFFGKAIEGNTLPLIEVAAELQALMTRTGHYTGPIDGQFGPLSREALVALIGTENLEERWSSTEDTIDIEALNYLRQRFPEND